MPQPIKIAIASNDLANDLLKSLRTTIRRSQKTGGFESTFWLSTAGPVEFEFHLSPRVPKRKPDA